MSSTAEYRSQVRTMAGNFIIAIEQTRLFPIREQNELLYNALLYIYFLPRPFLIVPIFLSDLVSLPPGFLTVPGGRPRSFSIFPTLVSLLTFLGTFFDLPI